MYTRLYSLDAIPLTLPLLLLLMLLPTGENLNVVCGIECMRATYTYTLDVVEDTITEAGVALECLVMHLIANVLVRSQAEELFELSPISC